MFSGGKLPLPATTVKDERGYPRWLLATLACVAAVVLLFLLALTLSTGLMIEGQGHHSRGEVDASSRVSAEAGADGQSQVRTVEVKEYEGSPQAAQRLTKCSDACFLHGTCNEELGECFCLPPWAGKDCDELAMPSCQLAPNFRAVCKDLVTCECQQECQKYALQLSKQCLRGTRPDGSKLTNLTEIFEGPRYLTKWNADVTSLLPTNYDNPPLTEESPETSPEQCPGLCGGKGACKREHRSCICSWASSGEQCEQTSLGMGVPCFNGCSGKGECVFGTCKCDKGFFGLDCSLYINQEGNTAILERPPYNWTSAVTWPEDDTALRPKIYVYDLPPFFNTWQGIYSNRLDHSEPVWFLERALNTPYRTANGEEADFFYLPLFIRNRDWEGPNQLNIVRLAREFVQSKYPFWRRHGGADHFILVNGDWGTCEFGDLRYHGQRHPIVDDMFALTLWGCTKSMHLDDERPCFRPGRDIVIPTDQDMNVYKFAPGLAQNPPKPPFDQRTILLYFRGFMAENFRTWGKGDYTWSFNVRQDMYRLYKDKGNTSGIVLEDKIQLSLGGWDYLHLRQMQRSTFCLAPAGWGYGNRGTQAVILGCIPVVIQPYTYQALDGDGLDWKEFAYILSKDDIPNIEAILRSIPGEEIEKKRKAMLRVRNRFIWSSPYHNPLQFLSQEEQDKLAQGLLTSDTFAGIMEALRLRLQKHGGS